MFRRRFVAGLGAGLGALWLPSAARADAPLADEPFALGVASGWPRPGSAVLRTRLIAQGAHSERLGGARPVRWSVAEDDRLQRGVQSGTARAEPEWAHSMHVEVGGLEGKRLSLSAAGKA